MNSQLRNSRDSKLLAIKLCAQAWRFHVGQPCLLSSFNSCRPKHPSSSKVSQLSANHVHSLEQTLLGKDSEKSRESERLVCKEGKLKVGKHQTKLSEPLLKEKIPSLGGRSSGSTSVRETSLGKEKSEAEDFYGLKQKERDFFLCASDHDFRLPRIAKNSALKKRYIRLITKKTLKEEFPAIRPIAITERKASNEKSVRQSKRNTYLNPEDQTSVKKITVSKRMKKWLNYSKQRQANDDRITELCKNIKEMLKSNK